MEDIPEDEQECANWLHKLYQEKVKLLVSLELTKSRVEANVSVLSHLGCLTGDLQQGRQVPRAHRHPPSSPLDTAQLPVLGHPASFPSH